ncbi:28S ribosomal protein S9, mitochondrial isoform X2 [Suricata suricatta]|uniref:28S ribosomal protein S9, mitochondrial isoform X2 n=1 Tax=Suricata suricatta TaxID=37032 RepID=UPI001155AF9F|nr:28S ribosomal protein S9, mitochondrial isoform X2 [Suricata suricatta]
MAAPCVSCGAPLSYRLFLGGRVSFARRHGVWKAAAAELQIGAGSQILRLRHTTGVTTKKNVAALRRETYTVDFIKKQIEEFNIGKRHLANMMGEDPETFTQEDIDRAIAYLFPSGLFEKQARPIMKHPEQIFPKQRAVQWGEDGRPFHFLFYTGKQSYYSLMHETYGKLLDVEKRQNQLQAKGLFSENTKTKDLIGSRWLIKEELEDMLVEKLSDQDYAQFIRLLERLLTVQRDAEEEFVQQFRRSVTIQSKKQLIEPLQYDEQGMAFSTSEVMQDREQLMFPFHFLDRLGKHDVTCTVAGGGPSSQAGAIRLAMAKALCSFVTEEEVEWMRQGARRGGSRWGRELSPRDLGTADHRPTRQGAEEAGPGGRPQEVHLEEALSAPTQAGRGDAGVCAHVRPTDGRDLPASVRACCGMVCF